MSLTGLLYSASADVPPWVSLTSMSTLLAAESPAEESATKKHPIFLGISVVWEGADLESYNLNALHEFRSAFSGLKVLHLISPAYFTKPGANPAAVKEKIAHEIWPGDEVGLYLQPWKSYVQTSGVIFRREPTFWGEALEEAECAVDCGRDVPLTIYRADEIERLVAKGKELLVKNGLGSPLAFQVGGWLTSDAILAAASRHGLAYDLSEIDSKLLAHRLGLHPLYGWLRAAWGKVPDLFEPRAIPTPAGQVIELGNAAGAVDYLTHQQVLEIFKKYVARQKADPGRSLVFHISLHQESALEYVPRLEAALQEIFAYAQAENALIRPLALSPAVADDRSSRRLERPH